MKEIVSFLKEILMMEDNTKVGLSQFKAVRSAEPAKTSAKTQVKLSDLIRGSVSS